MLKLIRQTILSLSLLASPYLYAGFINGTIQSGGYEGNTIDAWHFSLNTDGIATFDILASGVTSWIDSMIWLFDDDGSLGWDNLITSSDDIWLGQDLNGSLSDPDNPGTSLDPFISTFLNSGNYVLVVGSCCDPSTIDLVGMTQDLTNLNWIPNTGAYHLDYSDNLALTAVPNPAHLSLLGIGLAGIGFGRKFKK